MATIVEMINPLTGLPEQVDQLDHTAQEIDDAVDLAPQLSNPNLLDNWYFGNPVNQRGQTEHTGNQTGYFIDRWKLGGYDQTVTITNSGLHWSTTTGIWCTQILENFDELIGRTLTLSAIIDGVLYSVTGVLNESSGISAQTVGSLKLELSHDEKGFRFVTYTSPSPIVTITAAKLELGTQQTLAHQDENGVWQLNEIPDYGEQLRRCQRYFQVLKSGHGAGLQVNGAKCYAPLSLPVPLRTNPTVSIVGSVLVWNSRTSAVTGIIVNQYAGGCEIILDVSTTDAATGTCIVPYASTENIKDNFVCLSADL